MGRTVAELEATISEAELQEWMVYGRLEPFDQSRADLRAGIIASSIVNAARSKGKAAKPTDFMPDFAGDRADKTVQEQVLDVFAKLKTKANGAAH